jgi:quercetin dioxygenase-like cupin family protein
MQGVRRRIRGTNRKSEDRRKYTMSRPNSTEAIVERDATIVPPGAGTRVWVGSELITVKATAQETACAYFAMESATMPHSGPPLHRHEGEDEAFYVLEGEFLFQCDGRKINATPGTYVYLPRGTVHTYTNTGDGQGTLLVLCTPAGIERFFTEVGLPGTDLASPPPPPTPDQMAHLATTASRYGIEVLGPPLG